MPNPNNIQRVTVVVPAYNEEEALPLFFSEMEKVLSTIKAPKGQAYQFTILIVNDGSRDGTERVINSYKPKAFKTAAIHLSRNYGKENALFAGLCHAKGDAVIPMDVDLQDPPGLLAEMLSIWEQGTKIVIPKRRSRGTDSFGKRISAIWFYRLYNKLADRQMPENIGDYALLDRQVIEAIKQIGDRKRFNREVLSWVGFETKLIEFDRPERQEGEGKWGFWGLWNLAVDGIVAASTLPLRVWSYIGSVLFLTSILYVLWIILRTAVFGIDVPGYASTLIAVLFFGGLNIFALGIVGEYVARIYHEVRDRPNFIIRASHGLDDDA